MATPNIPNYPEGQPWYLSSLTHALYLDEPTGNVVLRTGFQGNIIITGNVNIPGTVTVNSSPADPVHTHITEIGSSGILTTPYMPVGGNVNAAVTGSVGVTGNVNIGTMPTITGTVTVTSGNINADVTGNVRILSMPSITGNVNASVSGNVGIIGNIVGITSLPAITGNVNIGTMPNVNASVTGTVNVQDGGNSITIDGNVGIIGNIAGITSLPAITGNVNADVTGNVNIGTMPNVNAAVSGNVGISSLGNIPITGNTLPISGNVTATISGTPSVAFDTGLTDAFGRLRVSEPYTLFDTQSRYYDHGQFDSSITGGTVQYDANSSTYTLNINTISGSSVIRETKRVFAYQPGKSLLVLNTFCMNTPKTNLRQRVGYFGIQNGIFLENDGQYNYLVIRSYSNGSLTEERIRQDSWNGDSLSGSGGVTNPSSITLNVDRTQIFWVDIEWLGVGTVRSGFVINGKYYLCHSFHHANIVGFTTTYMTTASLPIRYEITNTGVTSSASTLRQICSTAISEGGYNAFAPNQSFGRGVNALRLVTGGVYYPIVSVRLAPGRLDSIVIPRQVDILSTTVNYYRFVLLLNPTLTGATWAGTSSTGTVQYDLDATSFTGGTEIQSFYASSRIVVELGATDFFQFQLGRFLNGTSDVVTLAAAADNNNADVMAQLSIQELI